MPCMWPTFGRLNTNSRLGVGHPHGECTISFQGPPWAPHEMRPWFTPLGNEFHVRGGFHFDLQEAKEGGNEEFWYSNPAPEDPMITGNHIDEYGNCGPILITDDGSGLLGKKFITVTKSGGKVDWKIVSIGPSKTFNETCTTCTTYTTCSTCNYLLTIEILKG
jgi:hypothetical protein